MERTSISQEEMPIDEQVVTAIIYSISDLLTFTVEIRHQGKSQFIEDKIHSCKHFQNLDDARAAALARGAQKHFLALNRTYHEVSVNEDLPNQKEMHRYDYVAL